MEMSDSVNDEGFKEANNIARIALPYNKLPSFLWLLFNREELLGRYSVRLEDCKLDISGRWQNNP
jgi:hypothetical protein